MVVFDEYSEELSTKVQEHTRCSGSSSADTQTKSSTKVTTSAGKFSLEIRTIRSNSSKCCLQGLKLLDS